jgi:hypothetical protein
MLRYQAGCQGCGCQAGCQGITFAPDGYTFSGYTFCYTGIAGGGASRDGLRLFPISEELEIQATAYMAGKPSKLPIATDKKPVQLLIKESNRRM